MKTTVFVWIYESSASQKTECMNPWPVKRQRAVFFLLEYSDRCGVSMKMGGCCMHADCHEREDQSWGYRQTGRPRSLEKLPSSIRLLTDRHGSVKRGVPYACRFSWKGWPKLRLRTDSLIYKVADRQTDRQRLMLLRFVWILDSWTINLEWFFSAKSIKKYKKKFLAL